MRLSLALLLAGSLLLAGCGGDASSGTSEEQWAGKVTDVCKKSEEAARKAAADGQKRGLGQQQLIAYVLDKSIPIQKTLVEDLDAIEAPEDIQDDYDRFVGRLRDGLPLFEKLADAVRANKRDPELEAEFKQLGEDTRPFAQEHGLKACLADQG